MGLSSDGSLREAILETSLQLGREYGADGLTMRAIARRLNVSATALYQHFDSKVAILREIRFRAFDMMNETVAPAFECDSLEDQLVRQATLYIDFAMENRWLYGVLTVEDPHDWQRCRDAMGESTTWLRAQCSNCLNDGVEQGVFRSDIDPEAIADLIQAALHGFVLLVLRGRLPTSETSNSVPAARDITEAYIHALAQTWLPSATSVHPA